MCVVTEKKDEKLQSFEDGVYIVQKGQVTKLSPQSFGQDTLFWRNGEVFDVERSERIRVKS
jgi:hypothetical protein